MSQNKTVQYIKLLEEYDQAESLYDTTVYADPEFQGKNRSALPPLQQSFSVDFSIKPGITATTDSEKDSNCSWNYYSVWEALENTIMRKPQDPQAHRQNRATQEELSKNTHSVKAASVRQADPQDCLAVKARKKRIPSPIKGRRSPNPTKLHLPSKPNVKDEMALLGSVYQAPTTETRQPASVNGTDQNDDNSSCRRTQPDNGSVRQLEPEATSSIQQEKKDLAAKKRAAIAKKKGAAKKEKATAKKATKSQPTDPITPVIPKDPKLETAPRDPQPQMQSQELNSNQSRNEAGPRSITPSKKRTVNKEPPGIRKHIYDDASVSPVRTMKEVIMDRQPKSIVRQDLEELEKEKEQKPAATWMTLLTAGNLSVCSGLERTATPPPIRPCDLPRGSEIKKKEASSGNIIQAVAGELLQALGL